MPDGSCRKTTGWGGAGALFSADSSVSPAELAGGAVVNVCSGTVPDWPLAACARTQLRRRRNVYVQPRLWWQRVAADL